MRLALVLALLAAPVFAQDYTDGIDGDEAADLVAAAMAQAGVDAPRPNAPIRPFPACDVTPTVSPMHGNWSTAEIRCDGAELWIRALRTRATNAAPQPLRQVEPEPVKQPAATGPMAVALARTMERGTMVTAADIIMMPRGTYGASDVFLDANEVIGRRLKVRMGAEQILQVRHLEPAWIIREGTPIALQVSVGAMSVTAPGEALENGRLGDVISLKNLSSGQVVKGIVSGANTVQLRPNM